MTCIQRIVYAFLLTFCLCSQAFSSTWQWANPLPQGNQINDISYDATLGTYIAVGESGGIVTSGDGTAWSLQTTTTTEHLNAVASDGTQFVVVGDNGSILTSTNGSDWTARSSGVTNNLTGIAWSGSQYVAVGYSGTVLTSSDALTWTTHNLSSSLTLNDVVWIGSRYVLAGNAGVVYTSPDGVTWTPRDSGTTSNALKTLAWSGSLLVAVSDIGATYYSSDGITWTDGGGVGPYFFEDVAWAGGKFVTVGDSSAIYASNNAVSWSSLGSIFSYGTGYLTAVAYLNGTLFVGDKIGNIVTTTNYSTATPTWTNKVSGTRKGLERIVQIDGSYFALGDSTVMSSPDGITWTSHDTGVSGTYFGFAKSSTQYIAAHHGGGIVSSLDLSSWTNLGNVTSSCDFNGGLIWDGSQFVGACYGSPYIVTSPDGSTWTSQTFVSFSPYSLAWSGSLFVVVGDSGGIATSPDGISWTARTSGESVILMGVTWTGSQFIAVGQNSTIVTSSDGITWTNRHTALNETLEGVSGATGFYMAVGYDIYDDALVYTSTDSISWVQQTIPVSRHLTDVITDGNHSVAVGLYGTVLYSVQNESPVADGGGNQTVDEETTVTLDASASSDPDGSITAYSWTQTSGTAVTLTGATSASASFTAPTLTSQETLTFELSVTDDDNASDTDTVTITVNPVNASPSADAGVDQTVDEQITVTLSGSGSDSDGTIASYAWSQLSGSSVTLTNANTATASFTAPTLTAQEQLSFRLTVTDNEAATATDDIIITVNPVNASPTATAGNDQSADEQTTVTLSGGGSDTDGTIASYVWSQLSGTSVTLTNANTATTSFTAPLLTTQEQLSFRLTVTDNEGASATDDIIITVNPVNALPSANAGSDQSVDEQTTTTLSGSGSDTDGSIASYAWSQLSGSSVTLSNADTATVSFTAPTLTAQEQVSFRLTVTDNEGGTATDDVVVTVNPVNESPTLLSNGLNGIVVTEGGTFSWTFSASDPDTGDSLSYSVNTPSLGSADFSGAALTYTATTAGSETLTVTVTDDTGASDSADIPVTVNGQTSSDGNGDGLTDQQAQDAGLDPNASGGDTDNDGITDAVEIGDPNNPTDSDGDGLIDALEVGNANERNDSVTFIVPATTAGNLGLTDLSNSTLDISSSDSAAVTVHTNGNSGLPLYNESNMTTEDGSHDYPYGILDFSVQSPTGTSTVTISLPSSITIPSNGVVRKQDSDGNWSTVSSASIDFTARTITLTLTDNDMFDFDDTVGVIRDPVGIAVPTSSSPSGGGGGGGGSLDLVTLAIFGVSLVGYRRRKC